MILTDEHAINKLKRIINNYDRKPILIRIYKEGQG